MLLVNTERHKKYSDYLQQMFNAFLRRLTGYNEQGYGYLQPNMSL